MSNIVVLVQEETQINVVSSSAKQYRVQNVQNVRFVRLYNVIESTIFSIGPRLKKKKKIGCTIKIIQKIPMFKVHVMAILSLRS